MKVEFYAEGNEVVTACSFDDGGTWRVIDRMPCNNAQEAKAVANYRNLVCKAIAAE